MVFPCAWVVFDIFTVVGFVSGVLGQHDPTIDICRLFHHQTAVVDNRIYIDGGIINWKTSEKENSSNTWLLFSDIHTKDGGAPQLFIDTNNSASVPSLQGGTLWPDPVNKVLYLWGGQTTQAAWSRDFWRYDLLYKTWNSSDPIFDGNLIQPAWGAGTTSVDLARGYYYGGYVSLIDSSLAVPQMMVYYMDSNRLEYTTGPDEIPRSEGVLINIPVSDAGALVYFGGKYKPNETSSVEGYAMNNIHIYDQASAKWYNQTASGDVPDMRSLSCAGIAWADDRSSYNVYVVGGVSIASDAVFNDVYILSLPSFTWIKFWPRPGDNDTEIPPRYSAKCEVINSAQMMVVGGTNWNSSACDTDRGIHNLDLGQANENGAKWAPFNPNITSYQVPSVVLETIGGGPTGGATLVAPSAGFEHPDLSVYFARAYTPSVRTATRNTELPTPSNTLQPTVSPNPPKKTSRAPLIGAAVGGVIGGLILIVSIGSCIFFRTRTHGSPKESLPPELETVEPVNPTELRGTASPVLASSNPLYELPVVYELSGGDHTISPTLPTSALQSNSRS